MEWSRNPIEDLVAFVIKKQKEIIIGTAAVIVVAGTFFGYRAYRAQYEENAYQALVEGLEYLNAPIREEGEEVEFDLVEKKEFKDEIEKWEKVVAVFENSYDSFSRAGIAPMFLAYLSEGLLKQGKKAEAVAALEKALYQIKNDAVADYYRVKLALVQVDMGDDALREKGLGVLKELAANDKGVAHDLALYRLGEYYWFAKNFEEARNYWNQLVLLTRYSQDAPFPSPWAERAKDMLGHIDAQVR